ncbi:hypothetical protein V8G56_05285 [Gaetbulibacter aquiaggeris]|uniref:Uncharacterized protein n=1 Tax=Gaetbulibacter aquiaggeris TaxID=1735373 RepID=A0ABW7MMV1_9FLAO
MGRAALPLATLTAVAVAIIFFLIRGRFSLFFHGCLFIYIAFGSIRTYIAYKNEGGFAQLLKDALVIICGVLLLFVISLVLGYFIN